MMTKTRWFKGAAAGGLLLASSAIVNAQGIGLLPTETAELRSNEWVDITAGAVVGEHQQFYGARDTFNIMPEFRLFADLGMVNRADYDADIGAQIGALYVLPLDTEFDNAIRTSLFGSTGDLIQEIGGTLSWIVSYQPLENGVIFYGGLGLELDSQDSKDRTIDVTVSGVPSTQIEPGIQKTRVYPLINIGALMPIIEHVNVFTEFAYTDDWWIGVGLRVR